MPILSTLQPANVATPATAAFGFVVQVSVAPPGVVSARVTELVSDVTVLPPASCTATTGWVARAEPPVPVPGCVVNVSWAAAPAAITKLLLVADVNDPSVAVRV